MKRILCFGDSNTFGYIPGDGGRHDRRTRWPGRLKMLLGEGYEVIEAGVCGRTIAVSDPHFEEGCGMEAVGADVELYSPLDLFIVMLGTNDCKNYLKSSREKITEDLQNLLKKARESVKEPFQILVIAPAPLNESVSEGFFGFEFDKDSVALSKSLAESFETLSREQGYAFLDASKAASAGVDGVHLNAEGHEALADMVAETVKKLLG